MAGHRHLSDFVKQWSLENRLPIGAAPDSDETFEDILRQLDFMIEHAYSRYVPAMYSHHAPVFQDRMVAWMQNTGLSNEDQIALFQFILRIAYFSFDDFLSLYRTAYSNQISRWVWDCAGLKMSIHNFSEQLDNERSKHTWYASVTDSLIISEFYHANSITGIKCRPNFLTLKELGDPAQIKRHYTGMNFKRIVLLEDFVGTGLQGLEIVKWALEHSDIPILFCPMLICPDGYKRFSDLAATTAGRLKIAPVVKLGDSVFLSKVEASDALLNHVSALANRIHPAVEGTCTAGGPPYAPHGFHLRGDHHTGATVVMFSNTPDNTIPIVHFNSPKSNWVPVFPRVSRETS
ncbi:MAG: hypothetical protein J0M24_09840 [Verrucomicrobia bacterium]|nr:hypothetical protein [Verrucomicrobiota bacterium]